MDIHKRRSGTTASSPSSQSESIVDDPITKPPPPPQENRTDSPFNALEIFKYLMFIVIALGILWSYPVFLKKHIQNSPLETVSILNGMKQISHWTKNQQTCSGRVIAVGYNTNLDLIVNAIDVLEQLGFEQSAIAASAASSASASDIIITEDDLLNTFIYYFQHGSAAERFVQDKVLFKKILDSALALDKKIFHTGGNAGIMANRLALEGCHVVLGGIVGKTLKSLLNSTVEVIEYARDDMEYDEVHLIMEYARNSSFGPIVTPRANRFIISNDNTNGNMMTLESFHQHLGKGEKTPELIVLSGLHLLSEENIGQRLDAMMSYMAKIPYSPLPRDLISNKNIPIHLELASMSSAIATKLLATNVVPFIDSIGLNEQELGFIYVSTGGKKFRLEEFKDPTPQVAVEAILHIFNLASKVNAKKAGGASTDAAGGGLPMMEAGEMMVGKTRQLTRIHFHYLTYHIVAVRQSSAWSSERSKMAVSASSLEASNQACGFQDIERKLPLTFEVDYRFTPGAKIKIKIDETYPVSTWKDDGIIINIAPVLVCKHPTKTVGLGDSISTIACINAALVPKNLSGPPSEFSSFVLPDPKLVAQSSNSALLAVTFSASKTTAGSLVWSTTIPVDTESDFSVNVISQVASSIQVQAIPPSKETHFGVVSHHNRAILSNGTFGIDGNTIPSVSFTYPKAAVGLWTIQMSAPASLLNDAAFKSRFDAGQPQAFLLASNPSEYIIYTYLSSYNGLFVGDKVPVLAMLTSAQEVLPKHARPAGYLPTPIKSTGAVAAVATMVVTSPNGQSSSVVMVDDGLHADGVANDGIYGAFVEADQVGNYQTTVQFQGNAPNGEALYRTSQHIIPITSEFLTLTGKAIATQQNDSLSFFVEVEAASADIPNVRVYSEVWGVDSTGADVAVAWVGGITSLQKYQNLNVLSAVLDNRWIAAANATAPFTLKNIIVSDVNTFVPVFNTTESYVAKMSTKYHDVRLDHYDPPLHVITKQMRDGKMPADLAERYGKLKSSATGNGKLLLVHGYCAQGNPFTIGDFENAVAFEDPDQNRPNDEFAQMVGDFGAQYTDGFSIVGHSQGGLVALHLATFYHSGLDLSQALPGRVIQSVGSPYQGTGLAGTLASIGDSLGIGCSANNDLTHDGAALWLNSVPTDKRSLVYYTTTQYKTGGLVNYCNLAANSVLKWPNDGVTDAEHSELPGATYVNHIKGWCHTVDMKSPPQCQNSDNNKLMSSESVW
ncbi:conditioned medium factor [Cavenderia fasciculata]|uniref:Conditioned medium factor n=1 Tax=Cavenderia fasciculata TaxID=261658 RepID=F4PK35_CACFS|nr:conditioned medium factor [Cavenderia fasciculata]EGG23959.1 conditioned medium factor [Cavenderia fasciculata]|eukprot:XP_004361810.1 conditioned medium factor [Cavenderia fasciculata]